jgi:8-oxo-dGTP pyrophosphatase MutT (NUDIX family)
VSSDPGIYILSSSPSGAAPAPDPSWIRDSAADQTLEENWLFRLRRERFRSRASGQSHDFYVMHLADAVNVVAVTPDRRIVLVRQFRAGSACDSLETPGGLLAAGEDPLTAGARELLEETGYKGDAPITLCTLWANPSIMKQRITTILILNAHRVAEPRLDEAEELSVELVSAESIPALLRAGGVDHALAVAGLLWWLVAELPGPLALPGAAPPWWQGVPIARLMVLIAAIALALGLVINVGPGDLLAVFLILGFLGGCAMLAACARLLLRNGPGIASRLGCGMLSNALNGVQGEGRPHGCLHTGSRAGHAPVV